MRSPKRPWHLVGLFLLIVGVVALAQFGGTTGTSGSGKEKVVSERAEGPLVSGVMSAGLHDAKPPPGSDAWFESDEGLVSVDDLAAEGDLATPVAPLARRGETLARVSRDFNRRFKVHYYPVEGSTAREISRDIVRHSRRRFADRWKPPLARDTIVMSLTSWKIKGGPVEWKGTPETRKRPVSRQRCRVTSADVRVATRIALPKWDAPANVEPGLKKRWRTFVRLLERHERAHARVAIKAGREHLHKLVRTQRKCDGFYSYLYSSLYSKIEKTFKRQDALDRRQKYHTLDKWAVLFGPGEPPVPDTEEPEIPAEESGGGSVPPPDGTSTIETGGTS